MSNAYQISQEFHLQRTSQGIKLIAPPSDQENPPRLALENIFQLPFHVYFLDHQSRIIKCNDQTAYTLGLSSSKSLNEVSIFSLSDKESAMRTHHNNLRVLSKNESCLIEEDICNKHLRSSLQSLSIKFPWYDKNNEIIGIFGFGILIGQHSLANAILEVSKLGILDFLIPQPQIYNNNSGRTLVNKFFLSKREMECVQYIIRGKTAKEIAKVLNISYRTVEFHIDNIKKKMHVTSKSELIDKAISHWQIEASD